MTTKLAKGLFACGATLVLILGMSLATPAAADTTCSPAAPTSDPVCSTDNSSNNTASINSSPRQSSSVSATGGAGGSGGFVCIPFCLPCPPFCLAAQPHQSPFGGGGDGGAALAGSEQRQATSSSIGQGINSHNAVHSFNGNAIAPAGNVTVPAITAAPPLVPAGPGHLLVMGGRSFQAAGLGGATLVSFAVGGASNTGGGAVAP